MAVRDIVLYVDNEAALRKKSEPVRFVNRRIKKLIQDLKDTLLDHPEGIGLAAPQINVPSRVTGLDEWGKSFTRVFEGFDAVLVHHEIDHLNGVLFIDRVTNISDLYRVREDEKGELVRVPVTVEGM
jgi:peptide deformylase